jgi:hypothetical protein
MSVEERLQLLDASLQLTPEHREQLDNRQTHLVQEVLATTQLLHLTGSFISGSFVRHTHLSPLHDVNVFCVVTDKMDARQLLETMLAVISGKYPRSRVRLQRQSVNIRFADNIVFNIIPALQDDVACGFPAYMIPQIDLDHRSDPGQYIWSNPQVLDELAARINEETSGRIVPLVRLAKHWRRQRARTLEEADGRKFPLRARLLETVIYYTHVKHENPSVDGLGHHLLLLFKRVLSFLSTGRPVPDACSSALLDRGESTAATLFPSVCSGTSLADRRIICDELRTVIGTIEGALIFEAADGEASCRVLDAWGRVFGQSFSYRI